MIPDDIDERYKDEMRRPRYIDRENISPSTLYYLMLNTSRESPREVLSEYSKLIRRIEAIPFPILWGLSLMHIRKSDPMYIQYSAKTTEEHYPNIRQILIEGMGSRFFPDYPWSHKVYEEGTRKEYQSIQAVDDEFPPNQLVRVTLNVYRH